ncbi:hypothetical protein HY408_00720 [Candidatus Gottesmanbacteria bacterium]|nr:hypothetical protein [Candidatus Gottesmanbacteria bacterium]
MKKNLILVLMCVLSTSILLVSASTAQAAKKRVRTKPTVGTSYSKAKLMRSSNSVQVIFTNLKYVASISYVLSYTSHGTDKGAAGTIIPKVNPSETRDLYFGTCSKGVCTPDTNIQNATLTVTTILKSGGTHTKRYRIRI